MRLRIFLAQQDLTAHHVSSGVSHYRTSRCVVDIKLEVYMGAHPYNFSQALRLVSDWLSTGLEFANVLNGLGITAYSVAA